MTRRAWDPRLTTWVDRVDAHWHQLGIQLAARTELRLSLIADLSQALLEGATVADLIAAHPASFASDVAVAQGFETHPKPIPADPAASVPAPPTSRPSHGDRLTVTTVVVTGLSGSVFGGVAGIAVGLGFMGWVNTHVEEGSMLEIVLMLAIYVMAALVAAIGGGMAVASAYASRPKAKELGRRATRGLLGSGALATFVTISFAAANDYSTTVLVVAAEASLVVGFLVGGLVWAASRPSRGVVAQ